MTDNPNATAEWDLIDAGEAAKILQVTQSTIWRYADKGVIAHFGRTPGGHLRFSRAEIEELARKSYGDIPTAPVEAIPPAPAATPPDKEAV